MNPSCQTPGNRLGCLMEGCCFGKPYTGLGAICYTTGSAVEQGISYPVFPSQIFEMSLMVLLLAGLLWLYRREKTLLPCFLCGFGISIFLSEFFMDQRGVPLYLGMNFIQYISVLLVILGIVIGLAHRMKNI